MPWPDRPPAEVRQPGDVRRPSSTSSTGQRCGVPRTGFIRPWCSSRADCGCAKVRGAFDGAGLPSHVPASGQVEEEIAVPSSIVQLRSRAVAPHIPNRQYIVTEVTTFAERAPGCIAASLRHVVFLKVPRAELQRAGSALAKPAREELSPRSGQ